VTIQHAAILETVEKHNIDSWGGVRAFFIFYKRDDKSMKGGVRISLVDDCKEKYVTSEF